MIDKGPDTANPLALVGAAFLSAIGGWFLNHFTRRDSHPPAEDDDEGCAKKSELRTMRSDFKGDIAYVVERIDGIIERLDGMQGQLSRMRRDRDSGQASRGD
jgi:hypothetical protein